MKAPENLQGTEPWRVIARWVPPNYEWLYDQYVTRKKSTHKIAEEVGTGWNTIRNWLHQLGIRSRSHREAHILLRSTEHHAYTGKSCSEGTGEYRGRKALERSGVPKICTWCGQKSLPSLGRKWGIEVHHRDHDAENNDPDNLLYLCQTCHRVETALWYLYQRGKAEVGCKGRTITIEFREVGNAKTDKC